MNYKLLDCQVELILKSLEFYSYTFQYIYPRRRKSESREENLEISLIRDTYENISSQLIFNKRSKSLISSDTKNVKNFKKII